MRGVHFLAIVSIVLNSRCCTSWSLLPGWRSSPRIPDVTDRCSRWEHTDISSLNISQVIEELPGEEVLKRKVHEANLEKAVASKQEFSERFKLKSETLNRTQRELSSKSAQIERLAILSREAHETLDLAPEYDQENNSNVSKLQHRRALEQNVSKLEGDLRDAVLEFKNLAKGLNTDRVELELLRAEMENTTETIRIQEAAIRFMISNSRENTARCLATILHGRTLNLTTSLKAFDARWNETEVNHSTTLRKIRAGLEAEKTQLSSLLKKLELEHVVVVKNITRQREEWRNLSHQTASNLSAVASEAELCQRKLNMTIENSTKQSTLSDELVKAMKQNFTSTIRDLTRTLSKFEAAFTQYQSFGLQSWINPRKIIVSVFNAIVSHLIFWWILLCCGVISAVICAPFVRPLLFDLPENVESVLDSVGCNWQVLLGLIASFSPARWGWGAAWLVIAQLFGSYVVAKGRKSRIAKGTRVAHVVPLPELDHSIRMPIVLTIKVIRASLLAAALEAGGFSDPFVIVELRIPGKEPMTRKTDTKFKTKSPVWDEKFTFEILDANLVRFVEVNFDLMDKDLIKSEKIGWCKEDLQDVINSSPPNKPWAHCYPVRRLEQGRSYATLDIEWSYRIDKPAGFVGRSVMTTKSVAARYRAADAADKEFWTFVEEKLPSIYDVLCSKRILDRGDHLLVGAVLSYLLGWFRYDSGFLVPLAVVLSKLESLHVILRTKKELTLLGERDKRLKQIALWHKASALSTQDVPAESLPQLLNLLRLNVPQILVDAQAQAVSGVLEHFWPCYTDWITGYVSTLVESLVPGLIVDEILPGSTGPVARNVVCSTACPSDYPKTRDKLFVSVISADGIQPCDFLSGSADPYVIVHQKTGKMVTANKKTKVVKDHLTPKWDDPPFEFKLDPEGDQKFEFRVMDEDMGPGMDELLGSFEIEVNELIKEMNVANTSVLQKRLSVNQNESKQKSINVTVSFSLERATSVPPNDLQNRLQIMDMDLCWDPCYLDVKVRYPLGITFEVTAKITKLILPARLFLEWKSCPAEQVPTFENIRDFPGNFPKEIGGKVLKDPFEILQEASKYYNSFPNMDRVWLCMTAKPILSLDVKCTVGNIESLLRGLGILDLEPFVCDIIYGLFPMCVFDATIVYAAQAQKGSAQGDLAAVLDPVKAGPLQRRAEMQVMIKRAKIKTSCACYCVVRVVNTDLNGKMDTNAPQDNCLISHVTWGSGSPVFMNQMTWRITDLSRQTILIELWKKVSPSEFDELIGSKQMRIMDFVSNYNIRHDVKAKTKLDIDLKHGNRLLIEVKIKTTLLNAKPVKPLTSSRSFIANAVKVPTDVADTGGGQEVTNHPGPHVTPAVTEAPVQAGTDKFVKLNQWLLSNKTKTVTSAGEDSRGTLVVRAEILHSNDVGLKASITASDTLVVQLISSSGEEFHPVRGSKSVLQTKKLLNQQDKQSGHHSNSNVFQVLFEIPNDPCSFTVKITHEKKVIEKKLQELELSSKLALPKEVVAPRFPFHLEKISDAEKRNEWKTFVEKVPVQIYFLPYTEAYQPKLKITIHRAHSIPWCFGESPSPVYSQAELLTVLDNASLKDTDKSMPSAPCFSCFERRGNQIQKQMTDPSQQDHINPSWNRMLKNEFEFCVTPHLLSPGQEHQLVRFSLWHRFSDSTNHELGFGNVTVRDLHAKYYLSAESAEITVPITFATQDDSKGKGNNKEDSKEIGTNIGMRFSSFLVFSVSFVGDWSADLEVERLKENDKVKESQLKAAKVAAEMESECASDFKIKQKPTGWSG